MRPIIISLLAAILTAVPPCLGADGDNQLAHADSLWAAGQRAAALGLLEDLVLQAHADRDTTLEISVGIRLGARWIAVGQLTPAADLLGRTAALATAVRDTSSLLPATRWWSLTAGLRGRGAEADSLYERLHQLASVVGDRGHQGWACVGFASRQLESGNPEAAAQWYGQAADHLQAAGEVGGELWARNGLGIALGRQRLFNQALAVYQEVAARARQAGSAMSQANAVNNIGNHLMLLGDPGAAQAAFGEAAALFDSLGMTVARLTPALNLALCEMELGNLDSAAAILDSSLTICRTQGLAEDRGRFLVEKARLERGRGRRNAARANLQSALAMGDTLPAVEQARAVTDLAGLLVQSGQPGEGLALLDDWLPELRAQGLGAVSWEMDLARAEALRSLGQERAALPLLQNLEPEVNASGIARHIIPVQRQLAAALAAQNLALEAAAHLRLAADTWESQREQPGDFRWREVRSAGGRQVFLDLARLLADHPELAGSPEAAQAEIFRTLQRYKARTLLERMAGPAFSDSLAEAGPSQLDLATCQDRLGEGSLALDWYTGPDYSLLLAVTHREMRLAWLPDEAELSERVNLYLELLAIARPDQASYSQTLATSSTALADLVLGPVSDMIAGAERVTFCPDGPLHRLPFELMIHHAEDRYPARRQAWQALPSLSFLGGRGDRSRTPGGGVLVLAGTLGPAGAPLPGPAAELGDLSRRFGRVEGILVRAGDPPLAVSLLQDRRVLHVASHVLVDHRHPWQSAIDLPFRQPAGRAGPLKASQLLALNLTQDLTVLNGCATATGRVLAGEGPLGLATAFLAAGSRCVVATQWPVDDRTARKFSAAFYADLSQGSTIGQALTQARTELRGDPATAAPLQWGAYVSFGDAGLTVPLEPKRSRPRPAGLVLLLGLLVLTATLVYLRRGTGKNPPAS